MKALIISLFLTQTYCGLASDECKNAKRDSQEKHTLTEPSLTKPFAIRKQYDPYSSLAEVCKEEAGDVMINGQCFPAKVTVTVDGEFLFGGEGTKEHAYSVKKYQKNNFSTHGPYATAYYSPWKLITRLSRQYKKENAFDFYVFLDSYWNTGINSIVFRNSSQSGGINLDIFGISVAPNPKPELVRSLCRRFVKAYMDANPNIEQTLIGREGGGYATIERDGSTYGDDKAFGHPHTCFFYTRSKLEDYWVQESDFYLEWKPIDRGLIFKSLEINWYI